MKSVWCIVLIVSVIAAAMSGCTPYHAQGITAGALVGGVAGALVDHREPARGALIGGTLGGVVGGAMADVSYRNSRYSYYYDEPGTTRYYDRRAYPSDPYSYPRYQGR